MVFDQQGPGPEGEDDGRRDAAVEAPVESAGAEVALTFPDLPRLELDQLLTQLVERAQEVMATQGRLRGLLRANQGIIGDLALPAVLRRIVDAARELIGARYAALGVLSPEGGLAEFVHVGMPADAVERIGHLPQGKGLLGALIDDPRPIRLRHIADDARSSGFPSGHPPMTSFLGVPIRIRDEIFGNLYLAESTKGEFSAEDEELTKALAATAAAAIDNARLYEAARTQGQWLQASAAITRQLLSPAGDDATGPLRLIAEHSREIARADLVTVVLPHSSDGADRVTELRVEVAMGLGGQDLPGRRVPMQGSLAAQVFSTAEPLRVAHPEDTGLVSVASGILDIGPMLVVPLLGSRRTHGVLSAARVRGRPAFTSGELEMASSFASQAAVAIELAEARAEQERATMLDERDRIAADLHDHVIQRLFAAGLSLQSVATSLAAGRNRSRIQDTITDLDDTISQIRTTIFQLHQTPGTPAHSVRGRLLDVVTDAAPALGFEPAVRFTGLLEDTLTDDIVEDLLAVLREALTNIARHAQARSAEIDLATRPHQLLLDVRDDGIGIDSTTRRSGLANLRRRAERHGGTSTITRCDPSGTRLSWSIPLG
jgi:signal transduction histidine kinase